MRKGEKYILIGMTLFLGSLMIYKYNTQPAMTKLSKDAEVPFYTTASEELSAKATKLYRDLDCKSCHSLWSVRDIMQAVPAPSLDGIGALRDEAWFYNYFSAENPQKILPSRLKDKYKMPSYAALPEEDRKILSAYMASLRVKPWYLHEVKKQEYEKLTGNKYMKVQ